MAGNQETRRVEIIRQARGEARRWKFFRDQLRLPEATLGRDLKELVQEGVMNKKFDDEGKVRYEVFESELEGSEWEEKLESLEETRTELIGQLDEQGLFSDGMSLDEFSEFLKDNRKALEQLPVNLPEGMMSDAELSETKDRLLKFLFPADIEIESNTKVHRS